MKNSDRIAGEWTDAEQESAVLRDRLSGAQEQREREREDAAAEFAADLAAFRGAVAVEEQAEQALPAPTASAAELQAALDLERAKGAAGALGELQAANARLRGERTSWRIRTGHAEAELEIVRRAAEAAAALHDEAMRATNDALEVSIRARIGLMEQIAAERERAGDLLAERTYYRAAIAAAIGVVLGLVVTRRRRGLT